MFERERFIAACRDALRESDPQGAVHELMASAVGDPAAIIRALGAPSRSGVETIYRGGDLTILNLGWGPCMTIKPHDHRMWAVIGIYTGREDNIYWRRIEDEHGDKIEAAGAQALGDRDTVPLGRDIIHSVTNPIPRLTGAIHVYGGEFFTTPRSEWDPETLRERPFSVELALAAFEEANARM
jgi:predicted metal-dependent enzyme (double-stranded beta helix superfamily)